MNNALIDWEAYNRQNQRVLWVLAGLFALLLGAVLVTRPRIEVVR